MKSAVQTGRATGQAPQGDTQGKKHSEFWTPPKWILYLCHQPTFVKRCQHGLEKQWATFLWEGRQFHITPTSLSKVLLAAGQGDGFRCYSRCATVFIRNPGYWAEFTVQPRQWWPHITVWQIHGASLEIPCLGALAIAAQVNNCCSQPTCCCQHPRKSMSTQWNEGNISVHPWPHSSSHTAPPCFDPKGCTADRTAEGLFGLEWICSALKQRWSFSSFGLS